MLYDNLQLKGIEWYKITMQSKFKEALENLDLMKMVIVRIIYNGKS
jgi:hypothetical protein